MSRSVPVAGVVGALGCALGTLQEPRDHRAPPPTHSPAPTEQPTSPRRKGPGPARCHRGGLAPTAASWLACHTRHPAALAPTPHRPPLDPTHPTSRPPERAGPQTPKLGPILRAAERAGTLKRPWKSRQRSDLDKRGPRPSQICSNAISNVQHRSGSTCLPRSGNYAKVPLTTVP